MSLCCKVENKSSGQRLNPRFRSIALLLEPLQRPGNEYLIYLIVIIISSVETRNKMNELNSSSSCAV